MNDFASPNPYPASGDIVDGKYKIEKLLGEGGMGAVARATHVVLGGTLALKFMNPQFLTFPGAVERFVNEGRASKAIKSDHVLPVTDVGLLPNGTPYLLMECLYGLDLADLLSRDGPNGLPIPRAVHFVIQILRGLQAAHAIGIIHRDMKPSNCFVITHDGEEDFIKILDFGISKVVQPGSSSLTQTNSALGTPLYMSPEQARSPRDVDTRSDLYSVGVILYELLCGRTPFFSESGEFTEILFQLFTADPPPIREARPEIPEALAAVVHKALAREVPDRFTTALELAEALEPFAHDKSHALIDRMRVFKPPTKESHAPGEGLPTSMAAFSQLQRGSLGGAKPGAGTDIMVTGPKTDVHHGAPVTEILVDGPKPAQLKTELLRGQAASAQRPVTPQDRAMRASPGEAFGQTQLDSNRPAQGGQGSTRPITGASTDLGASRDANAVEQGGSRRSPLIYALPVLLVVGVAAIGYGATRTPKTDDKVTMTAEPPPTVSVPPSVTAAPTASTPVATAALPPPVLSASASTSASAPTAKPVGHHPAPPPKGQNAPSFLDTKIKE